MIPISEWLTCASFLILLVEKLAEESKRKKNTYKKQKFQKEVQQATPKPTTKSFYDKVRTTSQLRLNHNRCFLER
jgi:hypothetical protein